MDAESQMVSLTRRIVLTLALVIGIVSVCVTVSLVVHTVRTDRLELEGDAAKEVSYLAGALERPLWDLDVQGVRDICAAFSSANNVSDVTCIGAAGEKLFSLRRGSTGDTIRRHATVMHQGRAIGQVDIALAQEPFLGHAWIVVRSAIFLEGGTLLVIFLATGAVIRVQLSRPLEAMSQIVREYGSDHRPPVGHRIPYREFQEFGTVLSEMAGRIAAQMRELRAANDTLGQRNAELERVEQELRESERTMRAFFNSTLRFVGLLTPDGTLLEANQTALDSAGVPLSAVAGKPFWETPWWSHSTEAQERVRAAVRAAAGGELVQFESTCLAADGTIHTVDIFLKPIRDDKGQVVLLVPEGRDITDRKRMEEALVNEERFVEAFFDALPATAFMFDGSSGHIIRWNNYYQRVLGWSDDDLRRRPPLDHVCPRDRGRVAQAIKEVLLRGHTEVEANCLAKDGREIPTIYTAVRMELAGKAYVVGIGIDVSDRKRAEGEAQHLKDSLANIIDSMPSILVGIDAAGTVTQWNRTAEEFTGVSAGQATGRPIESLLPEFSPWIDALRDDRIKGRSASLEKLLVVKDGEHRFYDLMLYPLVTNGAKGAVVRIEDSTERTRIAELMVQTEKMMSVGGLAAGMAHEINNPLGIISQAAQNIERRICPDLPANQQAALESRVDLAAMHDYFQRRQLTVFLQDIRQASERAAKIVANMLQFSRKSASVMQLTNLAEVLDRAIELAGNDYDLKKHYDFRSIEIVREYDATLPMVRAVTVELEQVFLNLIRNAAQAMVENPSDRKPRLVLRLRRDGAYAAIEVEDNGPGMTEEVRRRVFEPFFTTKGPGAGTGLGLSVSYTIITQNHKGLISVASSPGNGARFTIQLPLAQGEDGHA